MFIGQAVEAIANETIFGVAAGQGHFATHCGDPRVERGVEAGDLRNAWKGSPGRIDPGQIVRLMAWRQRRQFGNAGANVRIDNDRFFEPLAAVNNAVADTRDRPRAGQDDLADQPRQHFGVALVGSTKLHPVAG